MKIVSSKDGSNTIYLSDLDEFYHSPRGAISESEYVFIKNGISASLELFNFKELSIFELGFGTGLNATLAYRFSINNNIKINYHSIEKYPIPINSLNQLNYNELLNPQYSEIINANWEENIELSENFNLIKNKIDVYQFIPNNKLQLIFFDAFAKSKQPDIWSDEVIFKMCDMLDSNGIFVSYACTASLKKQLKSYGFKLIKKQGALGKREMTFAIKN